ncbi:PHA/PHB synthase family protein [Porticoccus sp.]
MGPTKKSQQPKAADSSEKAGAKIHAAMEHSGQHKPLQPTPPALEDTPVLDRLLHANMVKCCGVSPVTLTLAWLDWTLHLSISPGKQMELAQSAGKKNWRLFSHLLGKLLMLSGPDSCIDPQPRDRRFSDDAWKKWPYSFYHQSFLLTEQWWQEATGTVRGVTRHHSELLEFVSRQWLDMAAPVNFPLTNPRVIRQTREQKGGNLLTGARNFIGDMVRTLTNAPPSGSEQYKVGESLAMTPGKVVFQNDLIELIQYSPTTEEVYAEPVLFVPAWIMKYYILDLSPENSMVKYLVDQGHTVFMISWKNPTAKDRNLGFEDYLNMGVMAALDAVNAIVPKQKVQAVGYCLGGTLLTIAAAAMARDNDDRLKSVSLFAAQVDFEEAGELLFFIDESQLAFLEDVMWEQGYLDKFQMAGAFQVLRSADLVCSRVVEPYLLGERHLSDLMAWNADATRMPYRMHAEYLRSLFLNNDLAEGHYLVSGQPVALSDIRVPIFTVSTKFDHVAPWTSVYKVCLYSDTDVTFLLTNGGHNTGIVNPPGNSKNSYQVSTFYDNAKYASPENWVQQASAKEGSWWPEWHQWLADHSGEKTGPPTMGSPRCGYRVLRDAPGQYVLQE